LHENSSGSVIFLPSEEKTVEIENWRQTVGREVPDSPGKQSEVLSETNRPVGLYGGAEDPADLGCDIWWETIGDEIYWIYPIYLGEFQGDYSRNSHLLEFHETPGCCHPLNPWQFQRLVELQGWTDLERMARYRARENIGSLLRGSRQAIFKLLHEIEECQIIPGRHFESSDEWYTTTGSTSPRSLGLPYMDERPQWAVHAPPPSMAASPRRSLTDSQPLPLLDPLAIELPYSLPRDWPTEEALFSPLSSSSGTPVPSEPAGAWSSSAHDLVADPHPSPSDSALWDQLASLPLDDDPGPPSPQRASSEPGGATTAIRGFLPPASDQDAPDCAYPPTPPRRLSWPPAVVDALLSAGRLDARAVDALREWEADLDARERRVADQVARRRGSEARLEREVARCGRLLAMGFSRGRVDAEVRRAVRDAEWWGFGEEEGEVGSSGEEGMGH
jgi:hypothetical protein